MYEKNLNKNTKHLNHNKNHIKGEYRYFRLSIFIFYLRFGRKPLKRDSIILFGTIYHTGFYQ